MAKLADCTRASAGGVVPADWPVILKAAVVVGSTAGSTKWREFFFVVYDLIQTLASLARGGLSERAGDIGGLGHLPDGGNVVIPCEGWQALAGQLHGGLQLAI